MVTIRTCPLPVHIFISYIPSSHLITTFPPDQFLPFTFLTKHFAHFSSPSTCINHLVTTCNTVYGKNLLTIPKALPSSAWEHFINTVTPTLVHYFTCKYNWPCTLLVSQLPSCTTTASPLTWCRCLNLTWQFICFTVIQHKNGVKPAVKSWIVRQVVCICCSLQKFYLKAAHNGMPLLWYIYVAQERTPHANQLTQ